MDIAMNLQQLRYIVEVERLRLSISAVARSLHTSQPGISKQVKLLEDELGLQIFLRTRNRLTGVTAAGEQVIACASRALDELANIRTVSQEHKRPAGGAITIAVSHTHARYVIADAMKRFAATHTKVRISLRYGDPGQLPELVHSGEADLAVSTGSTQGFKDLIAVPYRRFERVLVVPRGHELTKLRRVTLKAIARFPLVTYEPQFMGRQDLMQAFERAGLVPKLLVSAIDADVIKMCVEQGMGVAVISEVAFDAERDSGLRAIPVSHLFEASTSSILLHRTRFLPQHAHDFLETLMPSLSKAEIHRLAAR